MVLDYFTDKGRSTLQAHLDDIAKRVGPPTDPAVEFLLFSSGIYVADKKCPRRNAPDAWTRLFAVNSPVSSTAIWSRATGHLSEALAFLTGDQWKLRWRRSSIDLGTEQQPSGSHFNAVCLFSGGVDSLIGAINLLESDRKSRVVLVGHYDSTHTPGTQKVLADELIQEYGDERVLPLRVLVRPAPIRDGVQAYPLPAVKESTTRSRSLVFLGLGMAVAAALGPAVPLYIPENGFIAINVPLHGSRVGSCSTRTTHPYFLDRIANALGVVGVKNPIVNPYVYKTKGEMVRECKNQDLLRRVAHITVSCAHPERKQNETNTWPNCGYCYPCLIRRAAFNWAGFESSSMYARYRRDICSDTDLFSRGNLRGRDVRAVAAAFHHADGHRGASHLRAAVSGLIPSGYDMARLSEMHVRGLFELRALLQKATAPIRMFIGV
ncbi:hypothetical protein sce6096 [Sorangium cellulosum So ce56]|uniref:7-cyano-7-deazaguanine synthase n=1 Tax=Sorangium cellulosum (strain So ce56) TaxID=448385 RepID=A9GG06_SORC5|nr:hypothetical protein sce6096 [Sorangium cellulosum So ce56]